MIITPASLHNMFIGFKTLFNNAFATVGPMDWEKIAMVVPSDTESEAYPWLGSTTGFREWIGSRVVQNLEAHDFTIKNKPFENTIGVPRDKIADDKYGVFNPMFSQLGQDAKNHPNVLIFSLLKLGFSSLCYDGQNFFDTDHPVMVDGVETSVSNFGGGTGMAWYLLDLSRFVKPFIFQKREDYRFVALDRETDPNVFMKKEYVYGVDCRVNAGYGLWQMAYGSKDTLDADNLEAAIAAMMSLKKDNGEPMGITPTHLVVPPTLRSAALKQIKAETIEATTNINRDAVEVLVTPWLN